MCGIVYSKNFNGADVNSTILTRFEHQRSRGTTSFGFYLPTTDRLTHNVKESRIKALLNKTKNDEVLFHHRFSTSTIDIRNACHPFSTKDYFEYQYIGVHNGVLKNERELRKEHEKLGIKYVSVQQNDTFNDSESLIYDLARFLEGQTDAVKAEGRMSFVIVKRDKQGKALTLFFGHNTGSPLVMKKTDYSLTISSVGEGDIVPVNTLHIFDYETKTLRTTPMTLPMGYTTPTYTKPATGGATSAHFKSPAKKEYESWEDFRDDFQIPQYSPKQQKGLLDLKKDLEENMFLMRSGSLGEIRQEILIENDNDYSKAALVAILEAEDAVKETALMAHWIEIEKDKDTVQTLADYIQEVTAYRKMMETIADDFNMQSRTDEEVEPNEVLGFHQSPANRRLLPSAVLESNKSLDQGSKE